MTTAGLEPRRAASLLPVLVVAGAGLWLVDLTRSLWLDETVTAWVLADGLSEAFRRGSEYQFSWLAFVVPWLTAQMLGQGEVATRLPSLLAMAAATWGVARLTRELWEDEAGWLAALSFATAPLIVVQAANAKPYAFAVALVTFSMWRFVAWLKSARGAHLVQAAALGALSAYWQPVVGIVLVAPAAIGLVAAWREPARRRGTAVAGGVALAVLLPLGLVARRLLAAGASLSYASPPTPAAFFEVVAPPLVVGAAVLALWAGRLVSTDSAPDSATPSWALPVLLSWLLLPTLVALVVSRGSPANVFIPHYLIGGAPALPVLVGGLLASLVAPRGRLVAGAAILLAAVAARGAIPRTHEDWRGAAAVLRRSVTDSNPVLMVSGLVEGGDARWLRDAERGVYLTAPLRHYGATGRLVPFPWVVNASTQPYIDDVVAALRGEPRFALVTRGDGSDIARYLGQRLAPASYSVRREPLEGVYAAIFDRTASTPLPIIPR